MFIDKRFSKTIENEQKGRFLATLLSTLDVNLLRKMLAGKRVIWAGKGKLREGRIFNSNLSIN